MATLPPDPDSVALASIVAWLPTTTCRAFSMNGSSPWKPPPTDTSPPPVAPVASMELAPNRPTRSPVSVTLPPRPRRPEQRQRGQPGRVRRRRIAARRDEDLSTGRTSGCVDHRALQRDVVTGGDRDVAARTGCRGRPGRAHGGNGAGNGDILRGAEVDSTAVHARDVEHATGGLGNVVSGQGDVTTG